MSKLLLATANAKKLIELQRILDNALGTGRCSLVGLGDFPGYPDVPETGLSFGENALIKARAGVAKTGLPTVADDSGLAVDAMGGMPGIFSARWSGRHGDDAANLNLLLAQLSDVPDEQRGGAFVCAAALVLPSGREHLVECRMPGRIIRTGRGDGGFGYDPIFVADGKDRTNAELTPVEKDAISHRGKAFRALSKVIAKELRG
ncbi:MAG TPA: RdgB/HAM1 family non-canonical purine NTP pyrophosphatase [Actinoplanes sp.]|nr:RdgB/HAM1 family non-canonical purine NTP pyrophosphatase [Actinoplanes sp.]